MGARVISDGMTDWILEVSKLRKGSKEIIEKALKAGADVMADGFRSEIENIPTDERYVKDGEMKGGIRQIQKQGLLDSFGIISLVSELEETFDISIDAACMVPENFNSLAAIQRMVEEKMGAEG